MIVDVSDQGSHWGLETHFIMLLNKDSPRQVRVTLVTNEEFHDLLERTLCNEFSSKCIAYSYLAVVKISSIFPKCPSTLVPFSLIQNHIFIGLRGQLAHEFKICTSFKRLWSP